jgi:hypothetical protein
LTDDYQPFDPRGVFTSQRDGLPAGLLPTLHESQRIAAWRQELPVGERGQVRTGTDHSDEKGWIVGTRRELNKALGKSPSYSDYLERSQAKEILELKRNGEKFEIRLKDPERHREVEDELKRHRGV